MSQKLNVGIITDKQLEIDVKNEFLKLSSSSNFYDINFFFNLNEKFSKNSSYIDRLNIRILKIIKKIEKYIFNLFLNKKITNTEHNEYLSHGIKEDAQVTLVDGNINLNDLKKYELDLVINFLDDSINFYNFEVLKHGVLTVKLPNLITDQLLGFWESLKKKKYSTFNISLKSRHHANDTQMIDVIIPTQISYGLNQLNLIRTVLYTNHFLVEKIAQNNYTKPLALLKSNININNQKFNTITIFFYLYVILGFFSTKIFRKFILRQSWKWGIAYQFLSDWKNVNLKDFKIIKNKSNHFISDPFVIKKNNKYYCFVEDYSFKNQKGVISVYEISNDNHIYLGTALKEPFHLSYPFLFTHNGELYMCPETYAKKEIRLYKCINFPLEWKLEKVLMKNISAIDTSIIKVEDIWYLLTSIPTLSTTDVTSSINDKVEKHHAFELHIFYSDSPLSDKWSKNTANPVLFDASKGRNGGLILENNEIYRVSQAQGFNLYGESLSISKINTISKSDYKEENVMNIEPNFIEHIHGTHTLNFVDGLLVIDFLYENDKYFNDVKNL